VKRSKIRPLGLLIEALDSFGSILLGAFVLGAAGLVAWKVLATIDGLLATLLHVPPFASLGFLLTAVVTLYVCWRVGNRCRAFARRGWHPASWR
jgi:hypothetical protein